VVVPARGARSSRSRRRARRGHATATVALRTVASAAATAGASGPLTIVLRASGRYAALATTHGGVSAEATVLFNAAGHPLLREDLAVSFACAARPRAERSARRPHERRRARHRGGRPR
jgi:hypothetical protein